VGEAPGVFEHLGKKIDDLPHVRDAEQALLKAKAELDRAQQMYRNVRRQAVQELRDLRQKNLGDMLEQTLDYVRRHPGQGVGLAALAGFFLGRLLRR
jgi:ElaB/YqjD/DUF883 family membrane-anchored ribosome-binding protein